jgi:hypothetical protein
MANDSRAGSSSNAEVKNCAIGRIVSAVAVSDSPEREAVLAADPVQGVAKMKAIRRGSFTS